jgi:Bacterial Ig domain/Lysyl oxidase
MMGEHRIQLRDVAVRAAGRLRRRSCALAACVVVCSVALPTAASIPGQSAGASGVYVVTLPDLQIEVPTDAISIGTNPDTGDRQLQFTHITWDAGPGPFQIKPRYNRRTGVATFEQTIYKSRNGSSWRPASRVPVAENGVFDPPSDYRFPLTRFTLDQINPDGSPGSVVATSPKTDYCITADAYVGGVPDTPNSTSPPQSNCTNPHKALGFSVGWGDEYDQTDNGQPIDLTGVPDGTYVLHAMVDPLHVFTESNPDNDVTDTTLQISGDTVTVQSQTNPTAALPKAGLTAPASPTRSGVLTLLARAQAPTRTSITSVQFLLDGEPMGAPTRSAPYVARWTIGSGESGIHTVSAQVTDSRGDTVTAPVRTVDFTSRATGDPVVTAPPASTVLLVNPTPGESVSGTVPAGVRGPEGVRSLQFLLDNRPLSAPVAAAPFAVDWNTTRSTAGRHMLEAQATYDDGTTGISAAEWVNVINPAPPMTCFVLQVHVSAEGTGSASTPRFHTAAPRETLLAFVSSSGTGAGAEPVTVDGAGLTWKLVRRSSSSTGDAEIWTATAPRVLSRATVTSRFVHLRSGQHPSVSLRVIGMEGVDGVGASSAGSGTSDAPAVDLTTTEGTSLVFALGSGGSAVSPRFPTGWVRLDESSAGATTSPSWTQFSNQPTGAAGTVVAVKAHESSASRWNLVAVELVNDGG